jgi:hypothetical protein
MTLLYLHQSIIRKAKEKNQNYLEKHSNLGTVISLHKMTKNTKPLRLFYITQFNQIPFKITKTILKSKKQIIKILTLNFIIQHS